jgi:hypothetical protein
MWTGFIWFKIWFSGIFGHNSEPSGSIKIGNLLASWVTVSFSTRTLLHGIGSLFGCKVNNIVFLLFFSQNYGLILCGNLCTLQQ